MRARSLVLSTILCSTVLAGSLIFGQAANAMDTFRPQGNWAVTKVASKQAGGAGYCALSRRFGNGAVLTFARNSQNETSVAVDLAQNVFQTGKQVNISLDPGAGESRSYQTTPVSERGVVIRMGRDDKFYTALEQTGRLGINIDSQSYALVIPDVKSGTSDLSACVGTSVEPAAGDAPAKVVQASAQAPAPAPTAALVPSTMTPPSVAAAAPQANAAANGEAQSLREENIRLKNALEEERRSYENKMQASSTDSSNAAELNEKLRLLQIENLQLRQSANAANTAAEGATKMAAGGAGAAAGVASGVAAGATCSPASGGSNSAELKSLRDENARLKQDLAEQQKKVADLSATMAAKTASTNGDAAMQKRVADAEGSVAGLKDQISKLQAENMALKTSAQQGLTAKQATASPGDMKAGVATITQLQTAEAQLAEVKGERDRLAAELDGMKKADADGRVKVSSDNWNLEQATKRYNEAELEIRRLGNVVEQERAKCTVDKKNLEFMLFDPAIATKQQIAKLVDLENQLAEAKQATASPEDKQKLASSQQTIAELQQKLADAQANLQKQSAAGDKAAADEREIQDLQQKLADAQGSLQKQAAMNDKIAADKVAADQKAIADLQQKLAMAQDAQQKQAAASDKASADKIAADQAAISGLQQKLADAQGSLQKQMAVSQTAANDQKTIQDLQQKLSLAQADLQRQTQTSQQLAGTQKDAQDLKQKLDASNAEIAQLHKTLEESERSRVAAVDQSAVVDALKQEIVSLNKQVENMQTEKVSAASTASKIAQIDPSSGGADSIAAKAMMPRPGAAQSVSHPPVEIAAADYAAVSSGDSAPVTSPMADAPVTTAPLPAPVVSAPIPLPAVSLASGVAAAPAVATGLAAPVSSAPVQSMVAAASPAGGQKLMSAADVDAMLQQAGIKTTGGVTPVPSATGPGRVAYRWKTDGLFGTIDQKPMDSPSQYERMVQDYLDKTRSRCNGQFAAVPSAADGGPGMAGRVSSYEIACVPASGGGASAALIFSARDGVFTTIAHEASPESMDLAMDARDKMIAVLEPAKTASR